LIEQVLDNLIDNAIKHSGAPGSVELNVCKQHTEVVFQVADQGKGLQGQARLQGDESRGLGIGLQLCLAVAKVHSGRLNFSKPSDSGQGLMVTFALPLKAVQEKSA
ncbi:MAG: sensor histidine kinase, partial [Limnobacter sp.]